jgi:glycosyltransferase involved in cell wall biosynthesis
MLNKIKKSTKIAILIPTLNRAERLKAVADNIHKNTKVSHTIYFIIEPEDDASLKVIQEINEWAVYNKETQYVGAINTGYRFTKEPYIFCGSDDLDFHEGWDSECLKVMENPKIGITGPIDSWEISKSGVHCSHLFIRRSYLKKYSGVEDEENVVYSSNYIHLMCDIETEQTAMKRGAFEQCKTAFVEHNHWFIGKAQKDATYALCDNCRDHDVAVYDKRRKNFEQYVFEDAFIGKAVPVNHGKLSVVILNYYMLNYFKETIDTLLANTYNDFELIIIENGSDKPTQDAVRAMTFPANITVKKVFHEKNNFFTASINEGAKLVTGDYVAFLNNDIRLSKNWDIYLMNALDEKDVWLANPYQTDPGEPKAYGKAERAGGIDIRGTCFMLKKKVIDDISWSKTHFLPPQFVLWFSDSWLARQVVKIYKKKAVFIPESLVFHYGSKSSTVDMAVGTFWWIVRGDAFAYWQLTGEDTTHWLDICKAHVDFKE